MLQIITPAATNDLCTLDGLKRELGIADADTTQDDRLHDLIHQASARIARLCGRAGFGRVRVRQTEFLPSGSRRGAIVLERDLDPSIVSVLEGGVELAPGDWMLDGSLLLRASGGMTTYWYGSPVVVTYDDGFELLGTLPEEIERGALDLCRTMWGVNGQGRDTAIRSESAEGIGSRSYYDPQSGAGGLVSNIADALTPWQRKLIY